jgi:hypothetical protein
MTTVLWCTAAPAPTTAIASFAAVIARPPAFHNTGASEHTPQTKNVSVGVCRERSSYDRGKGIDKVVCQSRVQCARKILAREEGARAKEKRDMHRRDVRGDELGVSESMCANDVSATFRNVCNRTLQDSCEQHTEQ